MPKSKEIFFSEDKCSECGINVTYRKGAKMLDISGWYDHCVGIEGGQISLVDFCTRLGIRKEDLP